MPPPPHSVQLRLRDSELASQSCTALVAPHPHRCLYFPLLRHTLQWFLSWAPSWVACSPSLSPLPTWPSSFFSTHHHPPPSPAALPAPEAATGRQGHVRKSQPRERSQVLASGQPVVLGETETGPGGGGVGHQGFKEPQFPCPLPPPGHWEVTAAKGLPGFACASALPAEAMHLCGDNGQLTGTVSMGSRDGGLPGGVWPGCEGCSRWQGCWVTHGLTCSLSDSCFPFHPLVSLQTLELVLCTPASSEST